MPKTRRSNTIASSGGRSRSSSSGGFSGSGGGTGGFGGGAGGNSDYGSRLEEREMADRMENRLGEARTVTVNVESRTRGGIEPVDVTFEPENHGHARVASESGEVYDVDYENGTCTCRHFVHRQARCRHIEAADIARGRLEDGLVQTNAGVGQAGLSPQESLSFRANQDIDEEERRRALSGEEVDDNYFYTDHPEEFESNLSRLADEPLPYDYVNALNGSQATFGIELEFVGGNADAIARELYQLGICAYDRRMPYHSAGVPGKWRLERDGSVSDGPHGGEIISPVLQDTPETWKTIEKICEVAKRHGAKVNSKTGAHVHVGMDPLDTARQRWRRFFKAIAGNEESLYRIAGGELGQYRRNYYDYAQPFANNARRGVTERMRIETPQDVNRMAENISRRNSYSSHDDRYQGINLTNIYNPSKPNTVEFRYFNGSLDPAQIQANIKVAVGIMHTAEKARTQDAEGFTVTDNQKRRGKMLNDTTDGRTNKNMMKFIDTFFTRKKDKDHILGVLAKNTWRW